MWYDQTIFGHNSSYVLWQEWNNPKSLKHDDSQVSQGLNKILIIYFIEYFDISLLYLRDSEFWYRSRFSYLMK